MNIQPKIINTEFRSFSVVNKYPFTSNSSMCDVNGRQVPVSFIIDAIIYPQKTVSSVFISKIFLQDNDELVIELSSSAGVLGYAYDVTEGTNYFLEGTTSQKHTKEITETDTIIGSMVVSGTVSYIRGLVSLNEMVFTNNALIINPIRIIPAVYKTQQFIVNGTEVATNKPISIYFNSDRFLYANDELSLDTKVISDKIKKPLYSINNITPGKIVDDEIQSNNKVWLYSIYKKSDIRVITDSDKIMLLKIGDD